MSRWAVPRHFVDHQTEFLAGFYYAPGKSSANGGSFRQFGHAEGVTRPGDMRTIAIWFPYPWGPLLATDRIAMYSPSRIRPIYSEGGGTLNATTASPVSRLQNGWSLWEQFHEGQPTDKDRADVMASGAVAVDLYGGRLRHRAPNYAGYGDFNDDGTYPLFTRVDFNQTTSLPWRTMVSVPIGFSGAHPWNPIPKAGLQGSGDPSIPKSFNFFNTRQYTVPGFTNTPAGPHTVVHINIGYWEPGIDAYKATFSQTPGMDRLVEILPNDLSYGDPPDAVPGPGGSPGTRGSQMPHGAVCSVDYQYYAGGLTPTPDINFSWPGSSPVPKFCTTLRYLVRGENPMGGHLAAGNFMGGPTGL